MSNINDLIEFFLVEKEEQIVGRPLNPHDEPEREARKAEISAAKASIEGVKGHRSTGSGQEPSEITLSMPPRMKQVVKAGEQLAVSSGLAKTAKERKRARQAIIHGIHGSVAASKERAEMTGKPGYVPPPLSDIEREAMGKKGKPFHEPLEQFKATTSVTHHVPLEGEPEEGGKTTPVVHTYPKVPKGYEHMAQGFTVENPKKPGTFRLTNPNIPQLIKGGADLTPDEAKEIASRAAEIGGTLRGGGATRAKGAKDISGPRSSKELQLKDLRPGPAERRRRRSEKSTLKHRVAIQMARDLARESMQKEAERQKKNEAYIDRFVSDLLAEADKFTGFHVNPKTGKSKFVNQRSEKVLAKQRMSTHTDISYDPTSSRAEGPSKDPATASASLANRLMTKGGSSSRKSFSAPTSDVETEKAAQEKRIAAGEFVPSEIKKTAAELSAAGEKEIRRRKAPNIAGPLSTWGNKLEFDLPEPEKREGRSFTRRPEAPKGIPLAGLIKVPTLSNTSRIEPKGSGIQVASKKSLAKFNREEESVEYIARLTEIVQSVRTGDPHDSTIQKAKLTMNNVSKMTKAMENARRVLGAGPQNPKITGREAFLSLFNPTEK